MRHRERPSSSEGRFSLMSPGSVCESVSCANARSLCRHRTRGCCMWKDSSRSNRAPRMWSGAQQYAMWMVALFLATALILVPALASAQVITGGGTIHQNPNGSYSRSFSVTGTSGHIYDFSSSCTGYVTACGVPSPEGLSARTGHLSVTASVTYTTGSNGSGTLTLQTFDE